MRRRCGERHDRADQKAPEAHRSFSRNGGFLDETVGYHTEGVRRRGGGEMVEVFWKRLLFCALAAGACGAGAADPRANREIYLYQGADREARLVERAKKEGPVVLYSTMTVQDGRVLAAAFERKYGVKVTHWRGPPEKIVQRPPAETPAGRKESGRSG